MSTKTVYSIRVPEEIRELMKEMEDVNWQELIQTMVEELVKKKRKEKLLLEAEQVRKDMKSINAAELIREDRDAR
jgi:uncharacterized UPF0146 family protein